MFFDYKQKKFWIHTQNNPGLGWSWAVSEYQGEVLKNMYGFYGQSSENKALANARAWIRRNC